MKNVRTRDEGLVSDGASGNKDIQKGMQRKQQEQKKQSEMSGHKGKVN